MFILTQETQNPFVPSPSCTPYNSPPMQVSNDAIVNLGESNEVVPWNYGNELVDDPSEDDVVIDKDLSA